MQANHRKTKYDVLTVHLQLPSNNKIIFLIHKKIIFLSHK